jgi:uncharacterized membrane protein YqjE
MPSDDEPVELVHIEPTKEQATPNRSVDFLLAEYQSLREQRKTLMQASHSEVTIFFGAVTAIGLAFGLTFNNESGLTPKLALMGSAVLTVLLAIGFATLWRLTRFHGNSVRYAKGMNLVRWYFVERDSTIAGYLSLPVEDSTPTYERLYGSLFHAIPVSGSSSLIISILNSAISAALGYCLWVAICSKPNVAPFPAIVLMIIIWFVQSRYERIWFSKTQAEYDDDRKSLLDVRNSVEAAPDK